MRGPDVQVEALLAARRVGTPTLEAPWTIGKRRNLSLRRLVCGIGEPRGERCVIETQKAEGKLVAVSDDRRVAGVDSRLPFRASVVTGR